MNLVHTCEYLVPVHNHLVYTVYTFYILLKDGSLRLRVMCYLSSGCTVEDAVYYKPL